MPNQVGTSEMTSQLISFYLYDFYTMVACQANTSSIHSAEDPRDK